MADPWLLTIDAAGADAARLRALAQQGLDRAKVVRIVGAAPDRDPLAFWRSIGEAIGDCADLIEDSRTGELIAVDGQWMDVRYEPDRADTYRHHNVGQPLHTDGAYVGATQAREIALFYLARQAEAGGDSLFVDAETVRACAAARAPELLERLTTLPVRFGKGKGPCRISTVLYEQDGRSKINWNYFRVLTDQGDAVAALRKDFAAFLEEMVERGDVASFRLETGDAVFFRDEEVLHGRKAYAAKESGDRLLWKTYFTPRRARTRNAA